MKKNNFFIAVFLLHVIIMACNCTKTPPPPPPPPVDTEAPSVPTGFSGGITTNSVSLSWNASTDNVAVTGYKVYRGGVQVATTSSTSYTDNGLTPNTQYSYTVSAYDAAGNNSSQSVAQVVTTSPIPNQNSSWFAASQVTITPINGMIGNTNSNQYKISFQNTSSSPQMMRSLRMNFGTTAIKMQRTQSWASPDGTGWEKITATNGTVTFNDVWFNPGITEWKAVFSLKENVGVANGSPINISFDQMLDAQGMTLPIGGAWQAPVAAGTVDANTQPTKLVTDWNGYMAQSSVTISPNGTATLPCYNVTNVKVTGPGNARVASIKAKNPYGNLITFNNTSWLTNVDGTGYAISQSNITWSSDYVKVVMPAQAIISNSGFTSFFLRCEVSNPGPAPFNSGTLTPGLYGLELKSKYDLEILNSNGQLIDLSDVIVKQGANVVQN